MTAVVFLLYDGIEKEIVKGIYLVLEINRRIMTYLYSKTIFCALMDSYKWMTNISTPYVYQIENAENNRISFIRSSDAQKFIPPYKLFLFSTLHLHGLWCILIIHFYVCFMLYICDLPYSSSCCNRLLYNAQFQIKYVNKHVYNYFIFICLST